MKSIYPISCQIQPASPKRATALSNLVVSAIVHWNMVYLGRAVDHIRHQDRIIPSEVLKYVSPLSWEHINLTGTYAWGKQPVLVDGFRPLRLTKPLTRAA
jgi:hypothetical protein